LGNPTHARVLKPPPAGSRQGQRPSLDHSLTSGQRPAAGHRDTLEVGGCPAVPACPATCPVPLRRLSRSCPATSSGGVPPLVLLERGPPGQLSGHRQLLEMEDTGRLVEVTQGHLDATTGLRQRSSLPMLAHASSRD